MREGTPCSAHSRRVGEKPTGTHLKQRKLFGTHCSLAEVQANISGGTLVGALDTGLKGGHGSATAATGFPPLNVGVRWSPSIQNWGSQRLKFIALENKFCGSGSNFKSTCKIFFLSSREILILSFMYVSKHLCLLLSEFNTFTWQ